MTTTAEATLSLEECNDLRARVLRGEELSLEQARAVIRTYRGNQALIPPDKPKRSKGAKSAISKEQLDADLAAFGL